MAAKENTKVIVRFLPASLSSEAFWKLIEEKVADKVLYWYYVPGDAGLKKYVNSRAYIYFKTHADVCEFNEIFNGHVFVNSKGVEERAVVGYAPYQKFPKLKKRPDLRMGSIAEDADYLSFVEKLKEQPVSLPSAEVQLDRRLAEEKEKIAAAGGVIPAIVTPLMEDIRAKRAARNAPRSILQAPKRRGGGGDRSGDKKRASKEDKEKRGDAKANAKERQQPRDRNSRRRRDRDERKKKKKDKDEEHGPEEGAPATGQPTQQPPQAHQTTHGPSQSQSEKGKAPRTGLWMIRNHITNLEPGSITIQSRTNQNAPKGPQGPVNGQSMAVGAHPVSSLPMPPPPHVLSQSIPQPQQQPRKPRESGGSERDILPFFNSTTLT
eukprot:Phypoly_transcript_06370.p1 GENE.Phypoly_transcript_06370~~Phypoly_transcript_06370.p1  ORF type:complete len:379 (+),score=78.80 Phypoly_transcript_06370:109-1245(+)